MSSTQLAARLRHADSVISILTLPPWISMCTAWVQIRQLPRPNGKPRCEGIVRCSWPISTRLKIVQKELPYPLISDPKRELITALGAGEGGKTKRSHFIFEKGGKLLDKKIPVKPADRYGCHTHICCTSHLILPLLVLSLRWNSSRVYDECSCCYVFNSFQCCCLSSSYSVFVIYLLRCCFPDSSNRG